MGVYSSGSGYGRRGATGRLVVDGSFAVGILLLHWLSR